jgi:hypothetical protein
MLKRLFIIIVKSVAFNSQIIPAWYLIIRFCRNYRRYQIVSGIAKSAYNDVIHLLSGDSKLFDGQTYIAINHAEDDTVIVKQTKPCNN